MTTCTNKLWAVCLNKLRIYVHEKTTWVLKLHSSVPVTAFGVCQNAMPLCTGYSYVKQTPLLFNFTYTVSGHEAWKYVFLKANNKDGWEF